MRDLIMSGSVIDNLMNGFYERDKPELGSLFLRIMAYCGDFEPVSMG